MSKNAYITMMSTNNYLYGCIGLMYSWKATNPKYPFYCVVTKDITPENIRILQEIGYNVIVEDLYIPKSYWETLQKIESGEIDMPHGASSGDLTKNGWQYGWTKLRIFNYTQFDKLLYIDADSYIVRNIDDIFDRPAWSSITEYDAHVTGQKRLHSAFLVIEPNETTYNELIQCAENNPTLIHPVSKEVQLSADYDILNLYKHDWYEHPELTIADYTYIDSFTLRTDDFFWPLMINSLSKARAVHLTGPKPWIEGTQGAHTDNSDWNLWTELYLIYIKFVNKALEDLHYKGIAVLPLIS